MKLNDLCYEIERSNIKKILLVGNSYSIYVYFSKFGLDVNNILLVCTSVIPNNIKKQFPYILELPELKGGVYKFFDYLKHRINLSSIKYAIKNANSIEIFCVDHVYYSHLIHRKNYTLLEDGILNYVFENKPQSIFYKLLLGRQFGTGIYCNRIVLTGLGVIPKVISDKVELVSLCKKNSVKSFFGLSKLPIIKNKFILITQPLSEDCVLSEEEKINLYREIVLKFKKPTEKLLIKTHPRELTDYSDIFGECYLIKSEIPLELYQSVFDVDNTAITLFSTAIVNLNVKNKIFLGTYNNKKLEKKFGVINEKI